MTDETVSSRIERLVQQEHALRTQEERDAKHAEALATDRERLRNVEVELDRCWDLLRQRRARREAGLDPDEARARDARTVASFRQ
jgi:hypothetical protein